MKRFDVTVNSHERILPFIMLMLLMSVFAHAQGEFRDELILHGTIHKNKTGYLDLGLVRFQEIENRTKKDKLGFRLPFYEIYAASFMFEGNEVKRSNKTEWALPYLIYQYSVENFAIERKDMRIIDLIGAICAMPLIISHMSIGYDFSEDIGIYYGYNWDHFGLRETFRTDMAIRIFNSRVGIEYQMYDSKVKNNNSIRLSVAAKLKWKEERTKSRCKNNKG